MCFSSRPLHCSSHPTRIATARLAWPYCPLALPAVWPADLLYSVATTCAVASQTPQLSAVGMEVFGDQSSFSGGMKSSVRGSSEHEDLYTFASMTSAASESTRCRGEKTGSEVEYWTPEMPPPHRGWFSSGESTSCGGGSGRFLEHAGGAGTPYSTEIGACAMAEASSPGAGSFSLVLSDAGELYSPSWGG